MQRPDQALLRSEARDQIKQALAAFASERSPETVLYYAALQKDPNAWNDVQKESSRPAEELKSVIASINPTLREHILTYMDS